MNNSKFACSALRGGASGWLCPFALTILIAFGALSCDRGRSHSEPIEVETATIHQAMVAGSRYIVKFAPGRAAQGRAAVASQGSIHFDIHGIDAVAAELPEPAVAALRSNPAVVRVELDPVRVPLAESVPYGVPMVQADQVSDMEKCWEVDDLAQAAMAAHRQDGDRTTADARLREAQALLPTYYVPYLFRSRIAARSGDPEEALAILDEGREHGAEEFNLREHRAIVLAMLGRREEVLRLCRELFDECTAAGRTWDVPLTHSAMAPYVADFEAWFPGPMPQDLNLSETYEAYARGDAEEVRIEAERILDALDDELAGLEPLRDALASIVSDLDEHGADHLPLYADGDLPIEHFAQRLAQVEQRISEAHASGTVSRVFEEFMRNRTSL